MIQTSPYGRAPLGWFVEGAYGDEHAHRLSARFVVHSAAVQFAELAKQQSTKPSSIVIRTDYDEGGTAKRGRR